ncbi:MAG TPA: hypothetical protein VH308_07575 [Terracidiphilus sp.]|jgi:hypothetical protein|nr:hypothetical protein [Terracidiphilus sp.]
MVTFFTIFMRVLVVLFMVGIVGSTIVVSITFIEDFRELFPRREEQPSMIPPAPK